MLMGSLTYSSRTTPIFEVDLHLRTNYTSAKFSCLHLQRLQCYRNYLHRDPYYKIVSGTKHTDRQIRWKQRQLSLSRLILIKTKCEKRATDRPSLQVGPVKEVWSQLQTKECQCWTQTPPLLHVVSAHSSLGPVHRQTDSCPQMLYRDTCILSIRNGPIRCRWQHFRIIAICSKCYLMICKQFHVLRCLHSKFLYQRNYGYRKKMLWTVDSGIWHELIAHWHHELQCRGVDISKHSHGETDF